MQTPSTTGPLPFEALAQLDEAAFMDRFAGVVEHSAWVVARAWQRRPFASREALLTAMTTTIREASTAEKLALLDRHPELAGREALTGTMTTESNAEQGRLGLMALSRVELDRLTELNRRYRERFGFPFVVALRLHATLASVFDSFEQRLQSSPEQELEAALGQVFEVMRGRLAVCLQENPSHNPALSPV